MHGPLDFFRAQHARNGATKSAETVLHLDLPILPSTLSRRFWRFTYDTHCVSAIINTVPSCLSAVIASTVRRQQCTSSLPRIYQPPPSLSSLAAGNGVPAGLAEEIRFGAVMLSMSTHTSEDSAEVATTVRTLGSVESGDAGGSIVPLVELDMLCLLLHAVVHAGRLRTARYLRVWLGGGAAALVLWESDRDGGNQVWLACIVLSHSGPQGLFSHLSSPFLWPIRPPSQF